VIPGRPIEDTTVAPGQHWGRVLEPGEHLRLIDVEGQQAIDFL